MEQIKVMITDSFKLNRECWAHNLNNDPQFKVTAQYASVGDLGPEIAASLPDVIVANFNPPFFQGIGSIKELWLKFPGSRIIGIAGNSAPSYARKMMQLGASAYLTRNSSFQEMVTAILEVAKGKKYLCEEIKLLLANNLVKNVSADFIPAALSTRELEVVALIREGDTSSDIAEKLCISRRTVEMHRHKVFKKLRVKNMASLINHVNSSPHFY